MSRKFMLLPSRDPRKIQLVSLPEDLEEHEAYRHATGLIAELEERSVGYGPEEIAEALEDHGFKSVDFVMGPELE